MSYGFPQYGTGHVPPPESGMNPPPPPYTPPAGAAGYGYPGMTPAAAPQVGPFYNPAVPFTTAIPTLQDGTMIFLQGNIPYGCNRFSFNLKSGMGPHAENAFHLNPRFEGTDQVVRNTYQRGAWGAEERHGGFPLTQGQNFECIILVTVSSFRVAFNGQHFTEYNHRIAKEQVTHLHVEGNVTLSLVRFQPPAAPAAPAFSQPPVMHPPQPLTVPYTGPFPYGLQPGKTLSISGVPTPGAKNFILDFQTATGDIAFHISARLNENVVVRNSLVGGHWKHEERNQSFFPFQQGVPFTIIVLCEKHQYKVAVNGTHFMEFRHRLGMDQVRSLHIHGDVTLTSVQV